MIVDILFSAFNLSLLLFLTYVLMASNFFKNNQIVSKWLSKKNRIDQNIRGYFI
jgi:hypothetical protein